MSTTRLINKFYSLSRLQRLKLSCLVLLFCMVPPAAIVSTLLLSTIPEQPFFEAMSIDDYISFLNCTYALQEYHRVTPANFTMRAFHFVLECLEPNATEHYNAAEQAIEINDEHGDEVISHVLPFVFITLGTVFGLFAIMGILPLLEAPLRKLVTGDFRHQHNANDFPVQNSGSGEDSSFTSADFEYCSADLDMIILDLDSTSSTEEGSLNNSHINNHEIEMDETQSEVTGSDGRNDNDIESQAAIATNEVENTVARSQNVIPVDENGYVDIEEWEQTQQNQTYTSYSYRG